MPDPRSVMKEFRFLDRKRQTQGLTADEEIRFGELRDLVGGETGAAGSKPGFDVSAAAARLRESLLPAGLRNRPPPAPEPSPEPFGEIEPPTEEQPTEPVYDEQAYASAAEEQAQAGEGLFDPGSLAQEGAYDPNAAAWDPNAAAYDPNAAAYDPNAAAAWDPNAAAAWDPNAAAAYDPNAATAWDPNDPNAEAPAPHPEWGDIAADGTEPAQAEAPAWAPVPGGEYDGASWDAQFGEPGATPAPGEEPVPPPPAPFAFGSYDEAADPGATPAPELEALLPFDPAAEARIGPEMAETFGGPEAAAEPIDVAGAADLAAATDFHAAETMASSEAAGWQPEPAAIDQGFELASGGSFDARADAAAPEWASAPADAPAAAEPTAWDAPAPGEDLTADDGYATAPPDPSPAAALDFSAPELTDGDDDADLSWAGNPGNAPAPQPAHDAFDLSAEASALPAYGEPSAPEETAPAFDLSAPLAPEPELPEEELPTLDGDALLEEVPAEVVEPVEEAAPADAPAAFDAGAFATAAAPAEPAAPEPAAYEAPPADAAAEAPAPEPAAPLAAETDLPVDVIDEPEPEVLDPGQPADDFYVHGAHRVVVHTLEGQVKRGFIENADLAAAELALAASQGGPVESVATANVKAIFFMLAPGEPPTAPHGSRVRVTFRDGRQVAGFSPDYREGAFGFYMIPADARTSTGRIWVYQAAVKQVAVS
ncbi:MAG TPA: hypothetical protein VEB43_13375 [Anaeromyxobacter sp.]|nr:hypothetical protein [Anaeromyxobacter sp.]